MCVCVHLNVLHVCAFVHIPPVLKRHCVCVCVCVCVFEYATCTGTPVFVHMHA